MTEQSILLIILIKVTYEDFLWHKKIRYKLFTSLSIFVIKQFTFYLTFL